MNVFYFYISTSGSLYAVPNMAVFCSSVMSCYPGMLRRYFLHDFGMFSVAHIIACLLLLFFIITVLDNSYHMSKILYC